MALCSSFSAALGAHSRIKGEVGIVGEAEIGGEDRFPGPADVLPVVEVADSSLDQDRTLKLPAYAAAGIPECWLVNLPEQ